MDEDGLRRQQHRQRRQQQQQQIRFGPVQRTGLHASRQRRRFAELLHHSRIQSLRHADRGDPRTAKHALQPCGRAWQGPYPEVAQLHPLPDQTRFRLGERTQAQHPVHLRDRPEQHLGLLRIGQFHHALHEERLHDQGRRQLLLPAAQERRKTRHDAEQHRQLDFPRTGQLHAHLRQTRRGCNRRFRVPRNPHQGNAQPDARLRRPEPGPGNHQRKLRRPRQLRADPVLL